MSLGQIRSFASCKAMIFFGCLIINQPILSQGFSATTLVKVASSYVPIYKLKTNDIVTSYNFKKKLLILNIIKGIKKVRLSKSIKLIIAGKEIITAPDHKFYSGETGKWVYAKDLKPGSLVQNSLGKSIKIDNIIEYDHEHDFYCLSLKNNHNFFVSEHDLLAHNSAMITVLSVSAGLGSGAGPAGAAVSVSVCGVLYIGYRFFSWLFNGKGDTSMPGRNDDNDGNRYGNNDGPDPDKDPTLPERVKKAIKEALAGAVTRAVIDVIAEHFKYKFTKDAPFDSHGQPVYKKGSKYISFDKYRHKGGFWKLFTTDGSSKSRSTFNWNFTKRIGK